MSRPITKLQRIQVFMIAVGTLLVLTLIFMYFVHRGQLTLMEVRQQQVDGRAERDLAEKRIKMRPEFEAELAHAQARLGELENTMAAGDVYLWMVRSLDRISELHQVDLNQIDAPQFEPSQYVPKVPYEAARFTVSGRATYHNFGAFLAELENTHPFLRFSHIELEPFAYGRPNPEEANLLRFQAELTVLVKQREK